ncbi:hypothetical protein NKR17_09810 [Priestia flexa]|uniref:Uncharacterized protein n=1 Tax=Priestia flexa TaxID=86664 RepID=A0ABU4JB05_9BACI|nr:hypothetical protein [Priestia flexa]AQX54810.1 hypothetical protein BC359_11190 [Priestia flexa]MCA1202541.1 hypothetical protein [Priestia flexa]MCM3067707.1 hypothetical protein [Priestia flexa]MCP1189365.1 hypothetical protein [Priestia flexa]MDW8518185.1 hypothetical protein [Priestia flexa]
MMKSTKQSLSKAGRTFCCLASNSPFLTDLEDDEVFYYGFETVTKIEIINDSKESKAIRLCIDQDKDRFLMIMEIRFKPKFKVRIKEVFDG